MRRLAQALSTFLVETIGLEGALVFGGLACITIVAWSLDWRTGLAVAGIAAITLGVAVAYASTRPRV